MAGRDHARRHAQRYAATHPLVLVVLEHAQQRRLQLEIELADLVEEDRPAGGALEATRVPRARTREGAALVTKELALDQGRGERGTVGVHEGRAAARRQVVQGARHQTLPHAGLAAEQHRGLERRHV